MVFGGIQRYYMETTHTGYTVVVIQQNVNFNKIILKTIFGNLVFVRLLLCGLEYIT